MVSEPRKSEPDFCNHVEKQNGCVTKLDVLVGEFRNTRQVE